MLKVLRGEATQAIRNDAPEAVMMRSSAYATLAKLAQRAPDLVRADVRLPSELFSSLETEQVCAATLHWRAYIAPGRLLSPLHLLQNPSLRSSR